MMKRPRERDDKHLDFIRSLPCVVCGDNTSTEAAHVRFSDASAGKVNPGVGQKPHDFWTVPLCGKCHRKQHEHNEPLFWAWTGIDPLKTAAFLYLASGDHERGCQIVAATLPSAQR